MRRLSFVVLVLLITFAVTGCNESAAVTDDKAVNVNDKDLITQALTGLQEAFTALNLDKMMTFYSEDYKGQRGEDKEDVRQFVQRMIEKDALAGTEMNIDDIDIDVDGVNAVVSPVKYKSKWGLMKIENTLTKENGTWKLTSGRQAY